MSFDIPSALKLIRGETTDAFNRLHSISDDSTFVLEVADRYPSYPVFGNQRCGAWYVPPSRARPELVYFKSTDGHFGQWTFNLRRANLHLLPIVQASGGIVIVDSTRGGKSMPDALSKTIPLWCAVINEAVIKTHKHAQLSSWEVHGRLNTPPACVSPSEHEQMARLVPGLAKTLIESSFDLPCLEKPLRPFWITTQVAPRSLPTNCLPIVCVSASKQVTDGMERRNNDYSYIQGAADDEESWSNGLTSAMFWAHYMDLLLCSRDSILNMIKRIVESHCVTSDGEQYQAISAVNGQISLSTLIPLECNAQDLAIIQLRRPHHDHSVLAISSESQHLTITAHSAKKDQLPFLHQVLPAVDRLGRQWLNGSGRRLIVVDETASYDMAVGVLMLLLGRFFDDNGEECHRDQPCEVTKSSLRRRLEWIQQNVPQANPSRTTMKRINEYAISSLRQVHRQYRDPTLQGIHQTD